MQITSKKVAAISYKLSISDAKTPTKLVESVEENKPMYFLVGHSGLPEKFEEELEGKIAGDIFKFSLKAKDSFGDVHEEDIMNLPIEDFKDEKGLLDKTVIQVGRLIPMTDESGHHVRGRILEIDEVKGYIKMDFNHPLAGKDLHFEGKIVLVRDASKEEIDHGHVHGTGGHHHH
jgi:FKBP-type peptidyl-prolyl cis-trans isomerase SlyD